MVMEFDVTVEIPKGTRNKYVMDRAAGRLRLDRTLFTATQYPADYGFVEDTWGQDSDAVDALVLVLEPTFPGCLIRCRAIGMFRMRDEQGPTPKVVCVPAGDPRLAHMTDINDLDRFDRLEIKHFFEVYKAIEPGKRVEVFGDDAWTGRLEAEDTIRQAYHRGRAALAESA
jgi:inorganic pyrophosphatase